MKTYDHPFIGVDGCKGGWLAVGLKKDQQFTQVVRETLLEVIQLFPNAQIIFIDIPIGLSQNRHIRHCDLLARKLIGSRSSSIFPPPCRQAVYAETYEEANATNREVTGKGLSKQAWNLVKKIRETDLFLRENLSYTDVLMEAHPELNFMALVGKHMQFNKKTPEGRKERLAAMLPHLPGVAQIFEEIDAIYPAKLLQKDDILDAICLAINAKLAYDFGAQQLPDIPVVDEMGIPMQIVFGNPFLG